MTRLATTLAVLGWLGAAAALVYAIAVRISFRMLGNRDSVPPYPARAPWGDL